MLEQLILHCWRIPVDNLELIDLIRSNLPLEEKSTDERRKRSLLVVSGNVMTDMSKPLEEMTGSARIAIDLLSMAPPYTKHRFVVWFH